MLLEIASRFNVSLDGVYMVGDALRDLEAAAAAGAKPVLVLTGKGKKTQKEGRLPAGTQVFDDLAAFAEHLAP
jgi:D-glycero-D-manno-heptose 1,7-bisphosphate phosphatase